METSLEFFFGGRGDFSCEERSVISKDAGKVICILLQYVFPLGPKFQKIKLVQKLH